jgi:hypothetical protein
MDYRSSYVRIELASLVFSTLAFGCHPSAAGRLSPVVFQPTGIVAVRAMHEVGSTEAVYDAQHVAGKRLELALHTDGRWSGMIHGHHAVLEAGLDTIAGPGFNLQFRRASGVLRIDGAAGGRSFHATLSPASLTGYSDGGWCVFDFLLVGDSTYRGAYACPPSALQYAGHSAEVRLSGNAAEEDPPFPQFAFALFSAFPPY